MNKLAIALALTVFIPLGASELAVRAANASEISSQGRVFAYCLRGGPEGGTRCSYNTRAQCKRTAAGRGGSCVRNPQYARAAH